MRATAAAKKEKILSDLVETRRKILDVVSSLPPAAQDEIFLGVWSIKDLLAHLVGWDLANLAAAHAVLAGQLPDFYAYYDRDWKTYNARLVAEHKGDNFADLYASVEEAHQQLVEFLKAVPAAEFDKDKGVRFRGYKVTIARLLQVEISDEKTHHTQIKEFIGRRDQAKQAET